MPPRIKCRRIGFMPDNLIFEPLNPSDGLVELLEEELEALRLSDLQGLDQSEAAEAMGISRGTFQRILGTSRAKVSDALVNGRTIRLLRGSQCERGRVQGFRGCGRCHRGGMNVSGNSSTKTPALAGVENPSEAKEPVIKEKR